MSTLTPVSKDPHELVPNRKFKRSSTKSESTAVISQETLQNLVQNPLLPTSVSVVLEAFKDIENTTLIPNQEQANLILQQFNKLKFNDINNITYENVSSISLEDFATLNSKLKEFTSIMNDVKTPGVFSLLDDLSKNINEAGFAELWERAANTKPSLWARIKNKFDHRSANISISNQYRELTTILTERSSGLEKKISSLEKDLIKQENEQRVNIVTLNKSFEMYFETFKDIHQQLMFIMFVEKYYEKHIENLQNVVNVNEFILNSEIEKAKSILDDIIDKRLILNKTFIQLPITAQQNNNLVSVCKNLLKEIQNTRSSSFATIRSNMTSLGIALKTQEALMTNNSIKLLERNSSLMASQVTADLTVKGILLSSESRLEEARTIQTLIESIENVADRIIEAKERSREGMAEASDILLEATNKVKEITTGQITYGH